MADRDFVEDGDTHEGLSPDDIAYRQFTLVRRGLSETEVREFLRTVADRVAAARAREGDLHARLGELEAREAAAPKAPMPPVAEDELLATLREGTDQVLRSAQEAAHDVRRKAEERVAALVSTAELDTRRAREAADKVLADSTRQAEEAAATARKAAESDARELRQQAARDAEAEVEAARQKGRDMVAEARAVRERVMSDLAKRRSALESEIATLQSARARLLEASRVVRRTLTEATQALSVVEAEPAPRPDDTPEAGAEAAEAGAEPAEAGPEAAEAGDAADIFARMRAEQSEPPAPASAAPEAEAEVSHDDEAEAHTEVDEALDPDRELVFRRGEVLGPLAHELLRRAKRTLQDEQNEMLDRLRRSRRKKAGESPLTPLSERVGAWADVMEESVSGAYGAGRAAIGADDSATATPPPGFVSELTEALVTPLQERLAGSVAEEDELDAEELASRVGARYREWRVQELEPRLLDLLAAAYARGSYDAAPEGSRLRWVAAEQGQCPDCDDNALETTKRGEPFPTGQPHPPAHPGCRCLLALADGTPPTG